MNAVGDILLYFDHDKQVPLLGFGGEIWGTGFNLTSHCFAVNGNIFWPEVFGTEGMSTAYQNAL